MREVCAEVRGDEAGDDHPHLLRMVLRDAQSEAPDGPAEVPPGRDKGDLRLAQARLGAAQMQNLHLRSSTNAEFRPWRRHREQPFVEWMGGCPARKKGLECSRPSSVRSGSQPARGRG